MRVRISPTPTNGYEGWTVIWRDAQGERQRAFKSTRESAEAKAKELCDAWQKGEVVSRGLTAQESAEYLAALAISKDRGLLSALDEWQTAKRMLGGVSLVEAARFWNDSAKDIRGVKVETAVAEFLTAKEQDKVSLEHLRVIRGHLAKFKAQFNLSLAEITSGDLDKWLRGRGKEPRTRKNYRGSLSNFFAFCKTRRYLPDGWGELARIASPKAQSAPPACYHPDQFKALLRATQAEKKKALVCYFILRGMLGVRDSESFRIQASQIRDGHLIVEASQAKVRGRRRIIPLHGTSAKWLAKYAPKSGLIVPLKYTGTLQRTIRRLYGVAKVPRLENALRDSFISYRMAQTKDAPKVSDEAGNSPQKIHQHYRELMLPTGELITAELAAQWFSIPLDNS